MREQGNGYAGYNVVGQGVAPENMPTMQAAPPMAHVTTIGELKSYAKGSLVELPPFGEDQPFFARLRRPSMLMLAKQGKIPNSLLTTANTLFSKGGAGLDADDEDMLKNMFDIMDTICAAALVEPTLQDISEAGLELSDEQRMAIFNFTQKGVQGLETFRKEPINTKLP